MIYVGLKRIACDFVSYHDNNYQHSFFLEARDFYTIWNPYCHDINEYKQIETYEMWKSRMLYPFFVEWNQINWIDLAENFSNIFEGYKNAKVKILYSA